MTDEKRTEMPSAGTFIDSLNRLNAEDLGVPDARRKRKKKKLFNGITDVLLLICVAVFVVCVVKLIGSAIDTRNTKILYDEINSGLFYDEDEAGDFLPMRESDPSPGLYSVSKILELGISGKVDAAVSSGYQSSQSSLQIQRIQIKLRELKQKNPDIYGYIKINDTIISYPFVLTDNNEYYLRHDPVNKGYLDTGAIFADWRCSKLGVEYNLNTVLYGHNWSTGLMFHDLIKFSEEDFFRSHLIYIYTETGLYIYKPYSFFKTTEDFQYFRVIFDSNDDYLSFMNKMADLSMFECGETFTLGDRILTLSTCTNITTSGRYCLQAKLVGVQH